MWNQLRQESHAIPDLVTFLEQPGLPHFEDEIGDLKILERVRGLDLTIMNYKKRWKIL